MEEGQSRGRRGGGETKEEGRETGEEAKEDERRGEGEERRSEEAVGCCSFISKTWEAGDQRDPPWHCRNDEPHRPIRGESAQGIRAKMAIKWHLLMDLRVVVISGGFGWGKEGRRGKGRGG